MVETSPCPGCDQELRRQDDAIFHPEPACAWFVQLAKEQCAKGAHVAHVDPSGELHPTPIGAQWYRCKGCGLPCCIGPGGIGHAKPDQFAGIPNRVQCALYHRTHTREDFFELMAGESIEPPSQLKMQPARRS